MQKCRICESTTNLLRVEVKLNGKDSQSKKITLCKNCISNDRKVVKEKLHKKEKIIAEMFLALSNIDKTNKRLVKDALKNKSLDYSIYSGQFDLILPD